MGALTCLTDAEVVEIADAEAFLKRADDGDESVLPAIRKLLALPDVVEQMGGNLAARAQKALVDSICGKRLPDKEALLQKLANMRAELAGPAPTPLEQLVVERIAACWLQLHSLELRYGSQSSMAIKLATYYQKSIDRAQKRYLAAIKALAYVRRLARPQPVVRSKRSIASRTPASVREPATLCLTSFPTPTTDPEGPAPYQAARREGHWPGTAWGSSQRLEATRGSGASRLRRGQSILSKR